MSKIVPLTKAQAETLADLFDRSCIGGYPFEPRILYSGDDIRDSGMRRCCTDLTRKGLFRPYGPSMPGALLPDVQTCRDSWAAWRDKNPDVELWG